MGTFLIVIACFLIFFAVVGNTIDAIVTVKRVLDKSKRKNREYMTFNVNGKRCVCTIRGLASEE